MFKLVKICKHVELLLVQFKENSIVASCDGRKVEYLNVYESFDPEVVYS